jgi:hypothetical protein
VTDALDALEKGDAGPVRTLLNEMLTRGRG